MKLTQGQANTPLYISLQQNGASISIQEFRNSQDAPAPTLEKWTLYYSSNDNPTQKGHVDYDKTLTTDTELVFILPASLAQDVDSFNAQIEFTFDDRIDWLDNFIINIEKNTK